MSRFPGARLGPYEIADEPGERGTGEAARTRGTKAAVLKRCQIEW